jgi:LPXTG-motif cell wall-anchored protein
LSMKLMQHVRVLVVVVALIAMTLTITPDVANAKTKLDGKVDAALNDGGGDGGKNQGDGGANLDGKVDAVLKGDAGSNLGDKADAVLKGDAGTTLGDTTVDSATRADQQVDLDDPPLVGGDIKSINEVNSDLVPAKGEAKADGNIKAGELIDEGFCVRGALNQSASGCGGGTTPGNGSTGGGNGDMVSTPNIDAEAALGDNAVSSDTASNQRVDFGDSPLAGGETNGTTEVIAPLVPAEGEAKVDKKVEVGDLVNEDICLTAALNRNAGGCGSDTSSGTPDGGDTVTIPNINIDEVFGDNAVNHDTEVKEELLPDDDTLLDGAVDSATQVTAPALPVEGGAKVDGNVNAADKVKQDICLTADINRNGTGCGSGGAGGSGDDIVTVPDIDLGEILEDIDADSDTTIDETVNPDKPRLDGTLDSATDVDAPGVPASAKAELKGSAKVNELVNQDVGVCGTLNAADCKDDATPSNGNGNNNGIDLGELPDNTTVDSVTDIDEKVNPNKPELDGTVNNRNDIVAPIVPASTVVDLDGNAKLGELINQGLSSCTTLNAAGCADAAGSGPGDDSTPGDGGNGDGDDSTPADDDANAPSDGSGSDDNGSSSDDNGSSSGSSNPGSSNSGSGSSDNGDELAFAPPADSNRGGSGSSNSGSSSGSGNSGSGSSDDDDELAFATPTSGQASASSGSATKGDSLPDTGGVSPLMLIAALLFVGLGILLVTKRRRFNS